MENNLIFNIGELVLPNKEVMLMGVCTSVKCPALYETTLGLVTVFPSDGYDKLSPKLIEAICLHESGHIKAGHTKLTSLGVIFSKLLLKIGKSEKREIIADLEVLKYTSKDIYLKMLQYAAHMVIKNKLIPPCNNQKYIRVLKNRRARALKLDRE